MLLYASSASLHEWHCFIFPSTLFSHLAHIPPSQDFGTLIKGFFCTSTCGFSIFVSTSEFLNVLCPYLKKNDKLSHPKPLTMENIISSVTFRTPRISNFSVNCHYFYSEQIQTSFPLADTIVIIWKLQKQLNKQEVKFKTHKRKIMRVTETKKKITSPHSCVVSTLASVQSQ